MVVGINDLCILKNLNSPRMRARMTLDPQESHDQNETARHSEQTTSSLANRPKFCTTQSPPWFHESSGELPKTLHRLRHTSSGKVFRSSWHVPPNRSGSVPTNGGQTRKGTNPWSGWRLFPQLMCSPPPPSSPSMHRHPEGPVVST